MNFIDSRYKRKGQSHQSLDYLSSHKEEVSEALRIEASRVSEDAERVPFDELEDIDTSSEITQIQHFLLK